MNLCVCATPRELRDLTLPAGNNPDIFGRQTGADGPFEARAQPAQPFSSSKALEHFLAANDLLQNNSLYHHSVGELLDVGPTRHQHNPALTISAPSPVILAALAAHLPLLRICHPLLRCPHTMCARCTQLRRRHSMGPVLPLGSIRPGATARRFEYVGRRPSGLAGARRRGTRKLQPRAFPHHEGSRVPAVGRAGAAPRDTPQRRALSGDSQTDVVVHGAHNRELSMPCVCESKHSLTFALLVYVRALDSCNQAYLVVSVLATRKHSDVWQPTQHHKDARHTKDDPMRATEAPRTNSYYIALRFGRGATQVRCHTLSTCNVGECA